MGACLGKTSSTWPRWADLPPEIAGDILSRLPSHSDRLSFAAICHDWRLAARQQRPFLPPAMPLIINLGNGSVHHSLADSLDVTNKYKRRRGRLAVPRGWRVRSSLGSWLICEHKGRCLLLNPCRQGAIVVPCRYRCRGLRRREPAIVGYCGQTESWCPLRKMAVCASRLVVLLFSNGVCEHVPLQPAAGTAASNGATNCRMSFRDELPFGYNDIAFCRGKLFGVDSLENLFAHDLVGDQRPALSPRYCVLVTEQPAFFTTTTMDVHRCLAMSSDKQKLLMVRWSIPYVVNRADQRQAMDLRVFEADFHKGRWTEVKDLGGQTLFVGRAGSAALVVPEHYEDPRFRGGNRVFLLGHEWAVAWSRVYSDRFCTCAADCRKRTVNGSPIYCVYDMTSGEVSVVLSLSCPEESN